MATTEPVFSLFLLLLLPLSGAVPPQSPLTCKNAESNTDCTLTNAFGSWSDCESCRAWQTRFPTTEQEIIDTVGEAAMRNLSMKAVSAFSHTIPPWACPRQGTRGILINTRFFNRRICVDESASTVTADSGVGLRQLLDHLADRGWALRAAPYWDGVSIGGAISTGSHGSSLRAAGGALHDLLVSLSLVRPTYKKTVRENASEYAERVSLSRADGDFPAAAVSLGLMGVISTVTLKIEKLFKRNVTQVLSDTDEFLEQEILSFGTAHEFADVTWFPSQKKVLFKSDNSAPSSVPGNGLNDFVGFRTQPIAVTAALRSTEMAMEKSGNRAGKCSEAQLLLDTKVALGMGYKNDAAHGFTGYPVVGFQHLMQSSGSCNRSPSVDLLDACAWDRRFHGLFFYESTVVFKLSHIKSFISDVKRLRDAAGLQAMCGVDLYNGFLFRFLKASAAYLGHEEDSVVMDFNYYRADSPCTSRLDEDIWEEIEQIALFKYGAVPHWAKNRNVAFVGTAAKFPHMGKFLKAVRRYDPRGLFWSEWSEAVLAGNGPSSDADGCALDGRCVCRHDRHCAPKLGYFCEGGRVYADARVCRHR